MSAQEEEVLDSPVDWVNKHVRAIVDSGGTKGIRRWGVDILLLTTRGRKSGTLRRTALIYGEDQGRYLLVASSGGSRNHPEWYLNLVANPEVELQVGPETLTARARTATAGEKPRLWRQMASIWPDYDKYQTRTKREIPLVIVERSPET
jgi:deazaflavin-dependent oxidoreductase (nitroreductase family)